MQRINRAERRRSRRELVKRPQWGTLEEFTRSRIQSWLQDVLEEEVGRIAGPAQVGAAGRSRCARGVSQRVWQGKTSVDDGWHRRAEASTSAGPRAAVRE